MNKSTGNMYDFITHTWNVIKGECYHDCSYCYMKRWGKLNPVRFDEKELKTDLGSGNFIFVGSSCDMFAENIPHKWIDKVINHCDKFDNKYFFQTKNTERLYDFDLEKHSLCTTIESNRWYPEIMCKSPIPLSRMNSMSFYQFLTIEPILDFDLLKFIEMIKKMHPKQINIGADSGGNKLPEPPKEKILKLINELEKFTIVKQKSNLKRLLK